MLQHWIDQQTTTLRLGWTLSWSQQLTLSYTQLHVDLESKLISEVLQAVTKATTAQLLLERAILPRRMYRESTGAPAIPPSNLTAPSCFRWLSCRVTNWHPAIARIVSTGTAQAGKQRKIFILTWFAPSIGWNMISQSLSKKILSATMTVGWSSSRERTIWMTSDKWYLFGK